MTRIPLENRNVRPFFRLPPYVLNSVCPVTGERGDLENHHIWRRSFLDGEAWWVEAEDRVYPNRIALSPTAHERITTNRARLEWREDELFYVEGDEEKKLDFHVAVTPVSWAGARKNTPRATGEARRYVKSVTIKSPKDEENIIPELLDSIRGDERLMDHLGFSGTVPNYHLVVAGLILLLQGDSIRAERP